MKLKENVAICQEKFPILPLCHMSSSARVHTCKPILLYNIQIVGFLGVLSNKSIL